MKVSKFLSRKFLISAAAFLAAFFTGVAGVFPPEWCAVGMALSAGIYAASEAYVDGQSARSVQTVNTVAVTANTSDKATVNKLISPEKEGEQHGA